jgi:hypothetical protein
MWTTDFISSKTDFKIESILTNCCQHAKFQKIISSCPLSEDSRREWTSLIQMTTQTLNKESFKHKVTCRTQSKPERKKGKRIPCNGYMLQQYRTSMTILKLSEK